MMQWKIYTKLVPIDRGVALQWFWRKPLTESRPNRGRALCRAANAKPMLCRTDIAPASTVRSRKSLRQTLTAVYEPKTRLCRRSGRDKRANDRLALTQADLRQTLPFDAYSLSGSQPMSTLVVAKGLFLVAQR